MDSKYLKDLGLKKEDYYFPFDEDDPRQDKWKAERETYGFDSRETWDLDGLSVRWLYCHLMMYKEKASEIVNLEYHKFEFQGKEYTQLEAIDFIIDSLKMYILTDLWSPDAEIAINKAKDAFALYGIILPSMWW